MFASKIDYSEPTREQRMATERRRNAIVAKIAAEWRGEPEDDLKSFVGARLPNSLIARIDGYAEKANINRSEAIRRILESALG